MPAWESRCTVTSPSVLGKEKACSSSSCTGELWVNKGCRGQVSVKLTHEICINNASSNSRQQQRAGKPQPQIAIHRTVSRPFFFSLPTFDEKTTELHLHAEKHTETVLHLNLGHLVGFFFWGVQFCSTLCLPFDEKTTEQQLRHHHQDWRLRDEHQNN
jgi:hypothetical protein